MTKQRSLGTVTTLLCALACALSLLAACARPAATPAADAAGWQLSVRTLRPAPDAPVTLEVRLGSTGASQRRNALSLEIAPPDGSFTEVERLTLDQPQHVLHIPLDRHFGNDLPAGTWRVRVVAAGESDRVLAQTTFVVLPSAAPVLAWEARLPTESVTASSCVAEGTVVELAIRARSPALGQPVRVTPVIVAPNGDRLVAPGVEITGSGWSVVRVGLCSVVPDPSQQVGSWTVRWYRTDDPSTPIAEGSFTVTAPPTPTPSPRPRLEWQVPSEPVLLNTCDQPVPLRVRNATGFDRQPLQLIVRAVPPGRDPVDAVTLTLSGSEWTAFDLALCGLAGSRAIEGRWTVRGIEATTREPLDGQATFEVRPLPQPTPTATPTPPRSQQPPQQPPAASPPPPAPPPSAPPQPRPPAALDTDQDGLSDDQESRIGTDVYDSDTDGDGLKDGEEVRRYGTDPRSHDTDVDGSWDGEEILQGSDPFDPCSPWQFSYNCPQR